MVVVAIYAVGMQQDGQSTESCSKGDVVLCHVLYCLLYNGTCQRQSPTDCAVFG